MDAISILFAMTEGGFNGGTGEDTGPGEETVRTEVDYAASHVNTVSN